MTRKEMDYKAVRIRNYVADSLDIPKHHAELRSILRKEIREILGEKWIQKKKVR